MPDPRLELLQPPEQVLATLNRDGSRRWLRPRVSAGRFLTARRAVAWGLIGLFAVLPFLRIDGKPVLLLDVAHRRFYFFGATFLSTDTLLLALLLLTIGLIVFLGTAVAGRVWCGWACPQTVYMEFLFRPLQRLFEGTRGKGGKPAQPLTPARRAGLLAVCLVLSWLVAHLFLAYFVDISELAHWMTRSPLEHPGSFALVVAVTGLMFFNFTYFREQTCLVVCPYGRFQSVLLDRDSLLISYDPARGEPRGKVRSEKAEVRTVERAAARTGAACVTLPLAGPPAAPRGGRGDCIDCGLCVATCPTGIDIRNGLQMECVACAQCIDACDAVMEKIGRPRGLIRYSSTRALQGDRGRLLRGRVAVYLAALLLVGGLLGWRLATRSPLDVVLLRGRGMPFAVLPDGGVQNPLKIRITNRTEQPRRYTVELLGADGLRLGAPWPEPLVAPAATHTESTLIVAPREAFGDGHLDIRLQVRDDLGAARMLNQRLLGPRDPARN